MPAVGLAPTKSIVDARSTVECFRCSATQANSVMIKTRRGQKMACAGHTSGHTSPESGAAALTLAKHVSRPLNEGIPALVVHTRHFSCQTTTRSGLYSFSGKPARSFNSHVFTGNFGS